MSGCITYESQPVSEGTVVFENAAQGWIRVSPLDAEGRYFLQNVREGEYVVSIQPPEPELPSEATHSPAELRAALAATAIPDPKNIPRRVRASQTTPLTATVGQGRHEFDFELAELNR